MKKLANYLIICVFILGCNTEHALQKYGSHYQKFSDYRSLHKVVKLMPMNSDTSFVKKVLGIPIDMGFDYRYLVDSTGPNGCPVGAVFHINDSGKIDQKWIDEICE
jgi:hypothetical protein